MTQQLHTTETQIDTDRLWPGLYDPAHQAQSLFRKIMSAMAEPGSIITLEKGQPSEETEHAEFTGIFLTAMTLFDQDTKIWLSDQVATKDLIDNFRFHCGCQIVNAPEQADFAILTSNELTNTEVFNQGTEDYPHLSTTLIVMADRLEDSRSGRDLNLSLSGPGIEYERVVGIHSLNEHQITLLQQNAKRYPLAVDFIFVCGNQLMAVPRTTKITALGVAEPSDLTQSLTREAS